MKPHSPLRLYQRARWPLLAIALVAPGGLGAGPVHAGSTVPELVATIAGPLAGRIGFAAQIIGSDAVVAFNGDEAFPMASTYKLAIAGKVLALVDAGELRLEQVVEVPFESYVPSPVIADELIHPGVSLSIANLIEITVVHSDNTASDRLLELAGGPAAVTAWLRGIGVEGMAVDRSTAEISERIQAIMEAENLEDDPDYPAIPTFDADPRDHATPEQMLRLLVLLDRGEVITPKSRDFLLAAMGRTVTGPARIRGLLPAGTPVADKTGTLEGVTNDVGYVTLPDGRRFAVAVFTKGSTTPPADRERAVAEAARVLYDHFALE